MSCSPHTTYTLYCSNGIPIWGTDIADRPKAVSFLSRFLFAYCLNVTTNKSLGASTEFADAWFLSMCLLNHGVSQIDVTSYTLMIIFRHTATKFSFLSARGHYRHCPLHLLTFNCSMLVFPRSYRLVFFISLLTGWHNKRLSSKSQSPSYDT